MPLLSVLLGLAVPVHAATTTPASARWVVDRWTVDDGLPMNHVNAVAHGVDGRLWLATYDGLWSFDGSRFARAPIYGPDGTAGVRIHALARSPLTADLWITLDDGQIQRRGPAGVETWRPRLPGPYDLRPDARGGLWMAGPVHCALLVDPTELAAPPVFPAAAPTPAPPDCPPGQGATGPPTTGGPLQATPAGQVLDGTTLVLDLGHPIRDVLWLDGQLWLATTGAGLVRLRPRVIELVEAPAGRSPIVSRLQWDPPTHSVWARSHDDTWWSVADPTTPVEPDGLHTPRPGRPGVDRKSLPFPPPPWDGARRWWATQQELRRETESGDLEPISGPHDFWQGIQALPLPDGSLLLATTEGLSRVRSTGASPVLCPNDVPVASTRTMALLDDHTVAIGGAGMGTGTVDLRTDRALVAPIEPGVRHLRADQDWIWLATERHGLCAVARISAKADLLAPARWRCIDEAHGLGSPGVHASIPDGAGRVWMSANRGIGVASLDALVAYAGGDDTAVGVTWLDTDDGLLDAEANGTVGGTVVRSPGGALHFPTQHGVARVRPDRFVAPLPPSVGLDALVVDGETTPVTGDRIALPAATRLVELRWSAVFLAGDDGLRVRHRLSGDREWSAPTTSRSLHIRGLGPGPHTVELQAGIGEDWGPVRTVVLVRPPRLHERRDLRIAALLATLGLVFGAFAVQRRRARARARVLQARIDTATAALSDARDALAADNRTLARQTARLDAQNARLDAQNADLDRQNVALARQEAQLQVLLREKEARTRELEELDRLKRRLVANISHELRTPLTLVRGPIEVLAAREADPDKRAELALASRNAARIDGLVADLLLLSRAESGALPLRARPVPLASLLGRILGRFPAERVVLQPPPDEPSPGLWCDAGILDTAVGNLVANALEHGGPQHPVKVTAVLAEAAGVPGVRIAVRDHGPGVPEPARAALFHRFEKGDHQGGGLGLGLALARELVELHGGVLDHVPPEGGGACFRVWLPLGTDHLSVDDLALDTPVAETPAGPPPPAPDADSPLLLIEDNTDLRAFLAAQLGSRRAVVAVEDAESALAWLRHHTPRVVVSDIMLPGMSGLELVRELRQSAHTAELPVLLISARGEVHDRVEGLEVADDYLAKPFSLLELHARVDAIVRRGPRPSRAPADPRSGPEGPPAPAWLVALTTALDAHIDAHLDDTKLSARSLAAAVAMSQRTLSERLRAHDLPSPAEWIRQRRLDRAEQMLEDGRYQTVAEVAAAVGMSRSYFTRVFKARTGRAPGAQRR